MLFVALSPSKNILFMICEVTPRQVNYFWWKWTRTVRFEALHFLNKLETLKFRMNYIILHFKKISDIDFKK